MKTRINEIKVMQDLATEILHPPSHGSYHELYELAQALRQALDNPTGPLATLARDAYDDWTRQ